MKLLPYVFILVLAGCDLFATRLPEAPDGAGGTWLQPDTPERVVQNLRTAVGEMNHQNYLRSFSPTFVFEPPPAVKSREPILAAWSRDHEGRFFASLRDAAAPFSGHSLQLINEQRSFLSDTRFSIEAEYILIVNHVRTDEGIPSRVQGRLYWEIVQAEDGLWRLHLWVDHQSGSHPSWSQLKADIMKLVGA